MSESSGYARRNTVVVFAVLLLVMGMISSKGLDLPIPSIVRRILFIALPLAGAFFIHRGKVLANLGLTHFDVRGVAVAFVGSLALLAGLVMSGGSASVDALALWEKAVFPGLFEELLVRGFAFGTLFWFAGWKFERAMILTGVLFGLMHLPGAIAAGVADQAMGAVAVTAVGGCWYAWLFARWNRSLWVPITAHLMFNAWWVLFSAGATAAGGGSGATWGRIAAIAVITVVTFKWTETAPEGEAETA